MLLVVAVSGVGYRGCGGGCLVSLLVLVVLVLRLLETVHVGW